MDEDRRVAVDKRPLEVTVWCVHNFRLLSVFEFLGGCKRPAGWTKIVASVDKDSTRGICMECL